MLQAATNACCLAGLAIVVSMGITAQSALAQEESDALYLARAFIGTCGLNAGRIDKVAAGARALGYKELEGDMKAMLAPQDPNADYSGWLFAEKDKKPFLVGISQAKIDGSDYSICVVANPYVATDEVLEEIQSLTKFGEQIVNSEEAGQRYRVWATDELAERSFISAVDAPKLGIVGGTISLTAPTEK